MKHILTTFALLIVAAITAAAPAPQGFGYQAVVRDANNAIVANQQIDVTISILQGSADGTAVYSETHTPTTNANGLFTLVIGQGTPVGAGMFSAIDWSAGDYYLKTESEYGTSTTQLLSVPYAMYAEKAASVDIDLSSYALNSDVIGKADKSEMAVTDNGTGTATITLKTGVSATVLTQHQSLDGYYSKDEVDNIIANLTAQLKEMNIKLNQGAIDAAFSVSADCKVYFSRGNLQYQASTGTWRFAEHQWDYVGDDTYGNVYVGEAKSNNDLISENYDGWIDLFGWGTSGYNGSCPYPTNNNPIWGNAVGANKNLTGELANYDWGVYNAIINGGNESGIWRTLTCDEWYYLLNNRTNATDKYGIACVNGVNGLVILPDDFTLPNGLSFNSGVCDSNNCNFSDINNYTVSEWYKMENIGAVFLPIAGRRNNFMGRGELYYDYGIGFYWSSSSYGYNDGGYNSKYLYIYPNIVDAGYNAAFGGFRNYCGSVRLVRTVAE